jgi:hypothetical protein
MTGLACGTSSRCEPKVVGCGAPGGQCCDDYAASFGGKPYCRKGYMCQNDKCVKAECGGVFCECCRGSGKAPCKEGLACTGGECQPSTGYKNWKKRS